MAVRTFKFRIDTNVVLKISQDLTTGSVAPSLVNNSDGVILAFTPNQLDKVVDAYRTYIQFSDAARLESVATV